MRRTASASLVGSWCVAVLRFPHCSVSGLPLLCLTSCIPCPVAPSGQALRGSPQFCDASLPACHGLRTPADLPRLALAEVRVWPSGACKPSASAMSEAPFRSCPSTAGDTAPPAASRRRCRRCAHLVRRASPHDSAMDARLATGGWLALPRQGLAPCKRRQAYLGARTPGVRRGWRPERSAATRRL
jgi:hypothetical protein